MKSAGTSRILVELSSHKKPCQCVQGFSRHCASRGFDAIGTSNTHLIIGGDAAHSAKKSGVFNNEGFVYSHRCLSGNLIARANLNIVGFYENLISLNRGGYVFMLFAVGRSDSNTILHEIIKHGASSAPSAAGAVG